MKTDPKIIFKGSRALYKTETLHLSLEAQIIIYFYKNSANYTANYLNRQSYISIDFYLGFEFSFSKIK